MQSPNTSIKMENVENSLKTKVACLVSGLQLSGTSYISQLLTIHPKINAGFECGVLNYKSPRHFGNRKPVTYKWLYAGGSKHRWRVGEKNLEKLCKSDHFYDFYDGIIKYSPLFDEEKVLMIDKFPGYAFNLDKVLARAEDLPMIIIEKNPYFQYQSYKKRGWGVEEFVDYWTEYREQIEHALNDSELGPRIMVLPFKKVTEDLVWALRKIYKFLGDYNPELAVSNTQINVFTRKVEKNFSKQKKVRMEYDYAAELKKLIDGMERYELISLKKLV